MLVALAIAVTVMPARATFTCTPVAVYDGDGPVWCREGMHIRLAGIAAREMDGTCRSNQPCPQASAVAARNALVRLLGGDRGRLATGHVRVAGPPLRCRSLGPARGNRTAAFCTVPGVGDLSCAMVRSGTVLRWRRYGGDGLCQ